MFDLQSSVHLHEEELVRSRGRDDELDRPDAGVVDAARGGDRGGAESLARRRRRSAVTATPRRPFGGDVASEHSRSPKWTTVAVLIGEHLHLDVARTLDEPLDEQRVIAERRRRLAARAAQCVREVARRVRPVAFPCRRRRPTASRAPGSRSPIAALARSSSVIPGSTRPGTTGTPDAATWNFAWILSPIIRMAVGEGPMKTTPLATQASAKFAFSERNP